MSDPKLISPMLDDFVMGAPMSEHHGVRCCPAMIKDSDKKYIVKIISVPASQVQLEALLLTGAYQNEDSAKAYFKELADSIADEVKILNKLSGLEGFIPYEKCQIVPMEDGVGFDVYLLSPYRRSLERFLRKNTMTHLGAVNLGLDLCAALSICRRSGYLYVDLKPENIYITPEKEYRIGDLGFVRLDSLAYASLPDRFRSAFTAPEVTDAYSTLSDTMDIYALGLVLYQIFNGGAFPFDEPISGGDLPSPLYADYEMAEIIQKACATKPEDRWPSPIEMGQALVSYMQRNEVNDVPIVPPSAALNTPEDSVVEVKPIPVHTPAPEDSEGETYDLSESEDETVPDGDTAGEIPYSELSEETSDFLAQVDELLTHETPRGVVQPKPVEVPVPQPAIPPEGEDIQELIAQTVEEISAPAATPASEDPQPEASPAPGRKRTRYADEDEEEYDDEDYEEPSGSGKRGIIILILLILLAGLLFGGYRFYQDYYLQNVADLTVTGSGDDIQISIVSDIDDSLLLVVCTDAYGTKRTAPVTGGKASIEGLEPNTLYTVRLEIEGFHELTGKITETYNTPPQTSIISFSAITGSEDGSVILHFTSDGQEPDNWTIHYSTEGEEPKSTTFTGHMVVISGLSVGKEYTFRIDSNEELYIVGNSQLKFQAASLVFAENLHVVSCRDESLMVAWDVPAMSNVGSWTVRCYNSEGYDLSLSTTDSTAIFSGLDTTCAYTVEVIAEGMTTGTRCYVSANSVTITDTSVSANDSQKMKVSWTFDGPAPAGNWMLLYTIDGSDIQEVVRTSSASVTISPVVPGAHYTFTLLLEDGSTVFGEPFEATVPEAKDFVGYTVDNDDMTMIMVKSSDVEEMTVNNWQKLKDCPYARTTFKVGESVSIPVRLGKTYATSDDQITALFIIRDESGKLISNNYNQRSWTAMWRKFNCTLELPALPDVPGKYTVEIYFNGAYTKTLSFEVIPE